MDGHELLPTYLPACLPACLPTYLQYPDQLPQERDSLPVNHTSYVWRSIFCLTRTSHEVARAQWPPTTKYWLIRPDPYNLQQELWPMIWHFTHTHTNRLCLSSQVIEASLSKLSMQVLGSESARWNGNEEQIRFPSSHFLSSLSFTYPLQPSYKHRHKERPLEFVSQTAGDSASQKPETHAHMGYGWVLSNS